MNQHMRSKTTVYRLPLLLMGMVSLLGGVLSGLARLAWNVPDFAAAQSGLHAALMIGAFLAPSLAWNAQWRLAVAGLIWRRLQPVLPGFAS